MSIITNNKITEGQRDAVWVQHQQDRLTGTPQENKAVFDEYAELIRGKFNSALDSIDSALGDASTATSEIEGRVEALEEINVSDAANSARASAESASASATQAQTALDEATSYAVKHFKQVWTTTSSTFEEFTFETSGYVYTESDYYEVFVNGFKLNEDEYEKDGTTITLAEPITEAGNTVEVCVSKFVSPMTYVEQAQEYAEEAQGYASDAESYATTALGYSEQADASATNALNTEERINETAAETRTYKESAQASAESASASAEDAESFAQSANASADEAAASAGEAEDWAESAQGSANQSAQSATNANNSAQDAEAWAVGQRGGVDVPSTDETYHNNAKYWAELNAGDHAELVDIRIGEDGTTYPSAGDAVRRQVADVPTIKTKINAITEATTTEGFDETDNLVKSLGSGYYTTTNGVLVHQTNGNFSYTEIDVSQTSKIKINGTHHIYTTSQFNQLGIFVDDNDNAINSVVNAYGGVPTTFPYELNIPEGATKLYLNTDYKVADYPSTLPDGLTVYAWKTKIDSVKVPVSAINPVPVGLSDLSDGNKKIKIIAGVIRNSGNGWEYINDVGHEPLNLTNISVNNNGQIVINYGFTASKVLSLVATPDETFAGQYTIGGSVGLDNSVLNVYALPKTYGGLVTLSNNSIAVHNSNFTSATFNTSTGEIRIYHPTLIALRAQDKFNISANASAYNIVLGSQGNDYISLYLRDQSGAIVKDTTGASINIIATRHINPVFVNANNIVDAGGNFWIYGVMEI